MPWTRSIALLVVLCSTTSCMLYRNVTLPLDVNVNDTPVMSERDRGEGEIERITYGVDVGWGDASVAEAAREAGLAELHYADAHYLSVLGIYRRYTLHLYGTRAP